MEPRILPKRRTAYKFWIGDLVGKKPVIEDNMRNFLIRDKKVLRVNLIALVVNVYTSPNYSSLQLDDGSGNIRLKVWNEDVPMLENFAIGDLVLVVGKLNNFNDETYIRPEVVKKLNDLAWAKLRKLELTKQFGQVEKSEILQKDINIVQEETVQEAVPPSNENRGKVVLALESFPDGVEMEDLFKKIELDEKQVELVIDDLLKEGEIFQPRPGVFKLV